MTKYWCEIHQVHYSYSTLQGDRGCPKCNRGDKK